MKNIKLFEFLLSHFFLDYLPLFLIYPFAYQIANKIFPLWAESNKMFGGLSFSTEDVGNVLVVTGINFHDHRTIL